MQSCLIGFGSNLGDSDQIFDRVMMEFQQCSFVRNLAISRKYQTPAIGGSVGDADYLNACFYFETTSSCRTVFGWLQELELRFGRVRSERWGSRKIDLDLLLFGDQIVHNDLFYIPHPRMSFRRFVLCPACDIAADIMHPVSQLSLKQLLDCLDQRQNRLLVVTEDASETDLIRPIADAICRESDWNLSWADRDQLYAHSDPSTIKLLVYSIASDVKPGIIPRVTGYPAPSLALNDINPGVVRRELKAAIDAMSPAIIR